MDESLKRRGQGALPRSEEIEEEEEEEVLGWWVAGNVEARRVFMVGLRAKKGVWLSFLGLGTKERESASVVSIDKTGSISHHTEGTFTAPGKQGVVNPRADRQGFATRQNQVMGLGKKG